MHILRYKGVEPKIASNCFVAETATLAGDVTLEEGSSVWFSAVIRAEAAPIKVGSRSNVQDNCTIHTDVGYPVEIGEGVSIGHGAIVHGATVGSNCLVGMGAILLNGAKVGTNCVIGAGALVLGESIVPDNMLVLGSPAKVRRALTEPEIMKITGNANHYSSFSKEYFSMKK
ncbi:MAG TPA: gamma carbonic anhydrase family protein [Nitrososphaerales archaeon]|nr:gamma carbonic anhydrase family protein [Nitrososphaerales archaeon]